MAEQKRRVMKRATPASPAPAKPQGAVTKRPSQVQRVPVPDTEYDYDEDDAVPPVSITHQGNGDDGEIRGGWGASQETIDSTSQYAQAFKPTNNTQIIKILDAKPYASFRRHWIDRVGIGKRAYVCLQSIGRDCPLCGVGDKPGAVTAFNIALCSDDGTAVLKSWDCGVKLTQQLKTYNNDPKIGPLDKRTLYFAVSKTEAQQRQQVTTMVNPVREKDLEDWSAIPIDDEQLARLIEKSYTVDIITLPNLRDLEEVVAEITGEDTSGKSWGQ